MKYLELFFDRGNYAKITGVDYSRWGGNAIDHKAVLDSLTIIDKDVVDMTVFDKISTTTSSLVAKDKVFIMPGVTIPRYKIRETGKEIGFDIVRTFNKATKVIYCKKQIIDEMVKKQNCMGVEIKLLREIFMCYDMDTTELDNSDFTNIILDYEIYNALKHLYNNIFNNDAFDSNHFYTYTYTDDIYETLINDLLTGTKVIISDKDVIKQCNGSKPLDSESYKRLVSMFKTSQNQEIAMELLCNCDYDQSMVYILKLISKFDLRSMPGTNHVNYKSFRQYMNTHWGIDPSYYSGSIVDIVGKLADNGKLKREYLVEFKDEILEHVQKYGNNYIFKVASIQMDDAYKAKIVE
jgi:hypothetical protein